ncbi:somatostatin receptor type 2 [Xenopus laevis]|uniref:G-protein coupled receptors family 1 profile domain-containing protein n=2 Tax=Xenopus laevis TaxID=8355 RepID=A0A974BVV9_XENLA|nr:somatostatin receptor type 2 [Xenopus laevis]OCT61736.1 hypothetical protein XELAEV_18047765mg [Xenopus laevis]
MDIFIIEDDYNETTNLSLFDYPDNFTEVDEGLIDNENSKLFILYLVVSALGLIGNSLIIYVVLRYRQMKTTSNIYVFNLALGDLFYMLCLLLFALEIAYARWPLGVHMCKVFWAVSTTVAFSSIYFLTTMSVGICMQVHFPIFYSKRLGPKVAVGISISIWLICLLLGIPIYIFSGLNDTEGCKINWPDPLSSITFTTYQIVLAFGVPLIIICICLILTAYTTKCYAHKGVDKTNIVFLTLLTLLFVIIWLPIYVLEMMAVMTDLMVFSEEVYYTISLLPYLKCCIYPIMYGTLSTSFREIFRSMFCCR